MSEELTEMQRRILAFLKVHRERTGENACYLDDFFEGLPSEELLEGKGRFRKEVGGLEKRGYIKTVAFDYQREGMKFGCYEITRKGLRAVK
jgi:hypothetical protein